MTRHQVTAVPAACNTLLDMQPDEEEERKNTKFQVTARKQVYLLTF